MRTRMFGADVKLAGWLQTKQGTQIGTGKWLRRYLSLYTDAQLTFDLDESFRHDRTVEVWVVKQADPTKFGDNTLQIGGCTGPYLFLRANDEESMDQWLLALIETSIQGLVSGRIDCNAAENLIQRRIAMKKAGIVLVDSHCYFAHAGGANWRDLKVRKLEVMVEDIKFVKGWSGLDVSICVEFTSEFHYLHRHLNPIPYGYASMKSADPDTGVVNIQEQLSWIFYDHYCLECDDCVAGGPASGSYCGLPHMMIINVYGRVEGDCVPKNVVMATIPLTTIFGLSDLKAATLHSSWPMVSEDDVIVDPRAHADIHRRSIYPANEVLGQLSLHIKYAVFSSDTKRRNIHGHHNVSGHRLPI